MAPDLNPDRELPSDMTPFGAMADAGFGDRVPAARDVLPSDWATRYPHSPRVLAYGLTFYVAYQDLTQPEVAAAFGVSAASVRRPYRTLCNDLGRPAPDR